MGFIVAKGWYHEAEDRTSNPCYESIEKQTAERVNLYGKAEPLGDPIPINIEPSNVPDTTPEDREIRTAVKDGLKRGRAGGALQINAKHIKHWLLEAEEEKKVERKGRGDIVTWEQLANVRATSESHMGYGHSHMADDMGHHGTPAKRRYRFQRDRFAQAFLKGDGDYYVA